MIESINLSDVVLWELWGHKPVLVLNPGSRHDLVLTRPDIQRHLEAAGHDADDVRRSMARIQTCVPGEHTWPPSENALPIIIDANIWTIEKINKVRDELERPGRPVFVARRFCAGPPTPGMCHERGPADIFRLGQDPASAIHGRRLPPLDPLGPLDPAITRAQYEGLVGRGLVPRPVPSPMVPRTNLEAIGDGANEGDLLAAWFASSEGDEHERRKPAPMVPTGREEDVFTRQEDLPYAIARLLDGEMIAIRERDGSLETAVYQWFHETPERGWPDRAWRPRQHLAGITRIGLADVPSVTGRGDALR